MKQILGVVVVVALAVGACTGDPDPSGTSTMLVATTATTVAATITTVTAAPVVTTTSIPEPPVVDLDLEAGAIVTSYAQEFHGMTEPGARVVVNGVEVEVAGGGAFELDTWWNTPGPNVADVQAVGADGRSSTICVPYEFVPGTPTWVAFVGDSIMQGATPEIEPIFGEDVVRARSGRRFDEGIPIIEGLVTGATPPQLLVVGLGSNGPVQPEDFDTVMELAAEIPRVAFVNVRVDRRWEEDSNRELAAGVARYDNAMLIDWFEASEDEETLLKSDRVHPTAAGYVAFADLIAHAVFPHWSSALVESSPAARHGADEGHSHGARSRGAMISLNPLITARCTEARVPR